MRIVIILLLSAFLPLAAAVVREDDQCPMRQRLATFNTGLTPAVANYQQRRSRMPTAIRGAAERQRIDLLCLQEVWYERDVAGLVGRLGRAFPHHYSPIHSAVGHLSERRRPPRKRAETMPCSQDTGGQLDQLMGCLDTNCLSRPEGFTSECPLAFCLPQLYALTDPCRYCLTVSAVDISTALDLCANERRKFNRFNPSGLLVFSRQPISATYTPFLPPSPPALIHRGYISAQMRNSPPLLCTHLTSKMLPVYIEAALPFTSYEEQNRDEIDQLLSAFSTTPHVLMGDLNTGPARPTGISDEVQGEMSDNYDVLASAGYSNAYLDSVGECTYCGGVGSIGGADGKVIDHILTMRVQSDQNTTQRILGSVKNGVTLSDHLGVRLDVCLGQI